MTFPSAAHGLRRPGPARQLVRPRAPWGHAEKRASVLPPAGWMAIRTPAPPDASVGQNVKRRVPHGHGAPGLGLSLPSHPGEDAGFPDARRAHGP